MSAGQWAHKQTAPPERDRPVPVAEARNAVPERTDLSSPEPLHDAKPLAALAGDLAPAEIPIAGGQHHVTMRRVGGQLRLGMASEFKTVAQIAKTLMEHYDPDSWDWMLVEVKALLVEQTEKRVNEHAKALELANAKMQRLRQEVTETKADNPYELPRKVINSKHPSYAEYERSQHEVTSARQALVDLSGEALNLAKDTILELWEMGKDFLPTNLMPVGEVFRDKADFGGDTAHYTYHKGTSEDPIPIRWYKAPTDYPALQVPGYAQPIAFGQGFDLDGQRFGLADDNVPKIGWKLQKQAHNESREGQQAFNKFLNDKGVKAQKRTGAFVGPPLGDTHGFDGDHVKDLGFGGADMLNNYWPLDSRINRRAFAGYNAGYVVHYLDGGNQPKSRAIGGLVGKWFQVEGFLDWADDAIPQDGAATGGTPK